jgi:hypothetical protein
VKAVEVLAVNVVHVKPMKHARGTPSTAVAESGTGAAEAATMVLGASVLGESIARDAPDAGRMELVAAPVVAPANTPVLDSTLARSTTGSPARSGLAHLLPFAAMSLALLGGGALVFVRSRRPFYAD